MTYILLIDDNLEMADMTAHILKSAGYQVKHVNRGLAGAKQSRAERPLLILLDFNLPDVDGRTLILSMKRQLGDTAAPPFVALTARSGPEDVALAERFGFSAFIGKPFSPDRLLEAVNRLVGSAPT